MNISCKYLQEIVFLNIRQVTYVTQNNYLIKFIIGDIEVARQQLKMWKNYICHKLKFSHGMDDFWRRFRPFNVFKFWLIGQRDDFNPNITQCIDKLLQGDDSDILDFIEELCKIGEFDVVDLLLDGSKYMVNDLNYFK